MGTPTRKRVLFQTNKTFVILVHFLRPSLLALLQRCSKLINSLLPIYPSVIRITIHAERNSADVSSKAFNANQTLFLHGNISLLEKRRPGQSVLSFCC